MLISTQGDVGDLIFLLNLIRQIPNGPHTLCLRPGGGTKYRTSADLQKLYDLIAPLALKQPYIAEVKIIGPEDKVDWASERFREKFYTSGETLMQAYLNNLIKIHGLGKDFTSRDPSLFNVDLPHDPGGASSSTAPIATAIRSSCGVTWSITTVTDCCSSGCITSGVSSSVPLATWISSPPATCWKCPS